MLHNRSIIAREQKNRPQHQPSGAIKPTIRIAARIFLTMDASLQANTFSREEESPGFLSLSLSRSDSEMAHEVPELESERGERGEKREGREREKRESEK